MPFSHEALLYDGPDDFLSGTLPFIRAGLAVDEPVLVAVDTEKIERLRGALGADAERVRFANMAELGRNPARIIPAWRDFTGGNGTPVRGIGEPIWAGRSATELVECQLHEALLNVAFADAEGFRLLCPYDTAALDDAVIHEACCSHPIVDARPSPGYRDAEPLLAPLPPPPGAARLLGFELDSLADVRRLVEDCAARAGLSPERTEDLTLAIDELASNSVRHGGGRGIVRIWRDGGMLVCEVRDQGRIENPLAGRQRPNSEAFSGRGLWIANGLCELVQIRPGAVRAHMAL